MKVLMVGLGAIGQRHVRNLTRLVDDDLQIVAWRCRGWQHVLTDALAVEPGVALRDRYAIKEFDDLDRALAERPDVVFVTNPSSLHLAVGLAAARAGCHLFIEKPLSHTIEGVDELIALVEQRRLVAAVGYQMRFHPALRRLKAVLDEATLGPLLAVRVEQGEHLPSCHPYEDYREGYAARRDFGGGLLLSQIHELDAICWLLGPPVKVFALGGHWTSLETDVEDVTSLLLECRYGGRPLPVHVQHDFIRQPPVRRFEVVADSGVVVADLLAPRVQVTCAATAGVTTHEFEGFRRNDMFLDEMRQFLACVRGEPGQIVGLREARESLRVALAAARSIETGEAVVLADD